jgi:uncharacterized protein
VTPSPVPVSLRAARRLAVARQGLTGNRPRPRGPAGILSVVRELGYVQWDPVSVVAPSHLLSFWNRVDGFRPSDLERLLWQEKRLFEHWTPILSLVLTEDYPLFRSLMRRYPQSLSSSWGNQRLSARQFLSRHRAVRAGILRQLRCGPRQLGEFADHRRTRRADRDWAPGSDVEEMLFHLTMTGEVMIVGHDGNQNLWGLASQFLPSWVERTPLSASEFERRAALRALHALGTATPREIMFYFVRGRYEHLDRALADLVEGGTIRRVRVEGRPAKEERYLLTEDLPQLEALVGPAWEPRLSLLPPFDNVVIHQDRARSVFGFDYVREQFLPKARRRFGTYVLPILRGDELIGRIDPRLDKDSGTLVVNAVHAGPAAPLTREVGVELGSRIQELAEFVGAREVAYPPKLPVGWRAGLR